MKYVITIPMMFENRMYTARPAGKVHVNTPNMIGSIQSIIWLVCCCRGSGDGTVVIFCWTHMEAPTSTGRMKFNGAGAT
jgi:hypothetical protein